MSDATDAISLSADEFFLLWFAHHPVRDFPYFFGISPVGGTRRERAACTAAASERLAQRGLGTMEDPAPGLLEVVDVLAGSPDRIEFTCSGPDTAMWAVAAVQGSRAAVATRTGTQLRLWTQGASNLVAGLLGTAAPMEPGKGASANVRADDFEHAHDLRATHGTGAFRDVLEDAGVHRTAIPTIMRTVEDRRGGGTLAVNRRDDAGGWQHLPSRLSWADTATGRYAIRQDDTWVTITPADAARLTSMAGEVLDGGPGP